MSLAELKTEVTKLTPQERLSLAALLADLEEQSEDQFRAAADSRMRAMDAGRKVSGEDFEREHQRRQTQGR